MRTTFVVLGTIVTASLLAAVQVWAGDDDAKKGVVLPKGTLSGKIIDPDGRPVGNARIWVNTWGDKLLAEARSDAQGRFHLGPMEPTYRHRFDILTDATGFARQYVRYETYSVFPGLDCDLGTIQVEHGRIFAGQLLDVDGQPCRNAELTYEVYGPEYHLTTDSEGRFHTLPVPVGELYLRVKHPERRMAWITRLVQPGGEESLKPIRLECDVPIQGIVKDDVGVAVVGARIRASDVCQSVSDSAGRFTIHGFGPKPHFQFQLAKEGFVFINWGVDVRDDGIYWIKVGDTSDRKHGPLKELSVTLTPQAWIEGRAMDMETDEPVQLRQVVFCFFERKPNGEPVLSGCRSADFEQPEVGRFRLPYTVPGEFHLTFSATGYYDAEAFTPNVTRLTPIQGIVVKLKKKPNDATSEIRRLSISGTVTRKGKPMKVGWVGLWRMPGQRNAVNSPILRGRTVVGKPYTYASSPVFNGKYSINVPFQNDNWYLAAEEPGQPLTLIGPIKIDLNEKKQMDIECTDGGSIRGRVKNMPQGWEGHLWAVAFTKTAIQAETRVSRDGEFCFKSLPPGDYGLKVGHDAYKDSEVPHPLSPEEWKKVSEIKADPWQRAILVNVKAGQETKDMELALPPPGLDRIGGG